MATKTPAQIIDAICKYNCRNAKPVVAREYAAKFKRAMLIDDMQQPPITMSDIKDTLTYQGKTNMFRPIMHIGQRKLAIEEVQFIVEALKRNPEIKYVVYAGAAPSIHMGYVAALFAHRIKFLLVDPNNFDINMDCSATEDIRISYADSEEGLVEWFAAGWFDVGIYQGYFTDNIAKQCGRLLSNYVFISDIRTCSNNESTPYDYDVIHDLAAQFVWLNDMAAGTPATAYTLKYRAPYYYKCADSEKMLSRPDNLFERAAGFGIDFVADYKARKMNYLEGEYYLQSWAGFTSSETRLCYFGPEIIIRPHMPAIEYENKMFYYNAILRGYLRYNNTHVKPEHGFDNCADCAREALIWKDYNKISGSNVPVEKHVKYLSGSINNRSFLIDNCQHGYCYDDKNAWLNKLGEFLGNHETFINEQIRKKSHDATKKRQVHKN